MNYHSDLDIIFLYEADGQTKADGPAAANTPQPTSTSSASWRSASSRPRAAPSGYGRLYEVDARLRPTGRSGALATSFDEFARYFSSGGGQLWERMALCKARVVYTSGGTGSASGARAAAAARTLLARAAFSHPWQPGDAAAIRQMRQRLESTAAAGDLKRGPGGIVDVEFLVEMLQLRHAGEQPVAAGLQHAVRPGRAASGRIALPRRPRLVRRRLPAAADDRRPAAADQRHRPRQTPRRPRRIGEAGPPSRYPSIEALLADYENATQQIRRRFEEFFESAQGSRYRFPRSGTP